ncbi:hypothetical protein FSP39_020215 [Pinctada imbricata]|uniref:RING-type domain-containing protein n=1 Tax=Pinctada imbricata TaxID=66713 RepID=A0AA88YKX1_PINIB|nr:hypothetical protein FSP39_020215 [Pinctada imbricata]
MSDIQPLITLLEVMLNLSTPKVSVKPGGYSEDIFLELTDEEKAQFECTICYQVLKDPRQCPNKHKFCYSCIFVWSTSGPHSNHGKCPVCRTDGHYVRDRELEERIGKLRVKCHLKSCNWKGPLKYMGKHTHSTFTRTGLPYRSRFDEQYRYNREDELPRLERDPRNSYMESGTRLSLRPPSSNQPNLTNMSGASTARELYNANNTVRETTTDLRQPTATTSNTPRTPRPPPTPRPAGQNVRRVPTLPSIVSQNMTQGQRSSGATPETRQPVTSRASLTGREQMNPGYTNVRERLRDSRQRLDTLMSTFSTEIERGRRGLSEFHEERERRRQEQLEEVRDLGRRLNYVATELRRLLDTRRQLRDELEDMAEDAV